MMPALVYPAPSDHGRPLADSDYHSGQFDNLFIILGGLVFVILVVVLVANHKDVIGKTLKYAFSILCVSALLFGFIVLPILDRYDHDTQSPVSPYSDTTPATQRANGHEQSCKPQENEIGYKTKTYRIDICRYCNGSGRRSIDSNRGKQTMITCPNCHGTGKEKIAGNYR